MIENMFETNEQTQSVAYQIKELIDCDLPGFDKDEKDIMLEYLCVM